MNCRHCGSRLELTLVDLGSAPPSNAYLTSESLARPEKWYPLRVLVCEDCWLVQTQDVTDAAELFDSDYAYFSGFSETWLEHCARNVDDLVRRFGLDSTSHFVELATNDGTLLQLAAARGLVCTGVEPTASTATAARARGLTVIEEFFGVELARQIVADRSPADVIVANNVLAHVPDINDFTSGVAALLAADGVAVFEFPHLMKLVDDVQFDTIYHEHFSYLSFTAVNRIFASNGLTIFDVVPVETHGGSLRVFARRADHPGRLPGSRVEALVAQEDQAGVSSRSYYEGFQPACDRVKNDLLEFLLSAAREGRSVIGYGAAAKGNTLFNYAGVRPDLVPWVVDRNPVKQGRYLPGSRVPVGAETLIDDLRPDYVLVLPWNLRREVMAQLSHIRDWGGRFVTAIPRLEVM